MSCKIVAEIGINHNGHLETALDLIGAAKAAGCDAVKFQKRTVEVVYTAEELAKPRESEYGHTNGDLKRGLELSFEDYCAIDNHCKALGIEWFASCWDEQALDFISSFNPPCYKIASACLTDSYLLKRHRVKAKPIILSTGMSTLEEIDHAVRILGYEDLTLLHCTSTYPAWYVECNLQAITSLRRRYLLPVGFSGHHLGVVPDFAAVALGAVIVERHITLDRTMWGSDQNASLEPAELKELVAGIRIVEAAGAG